MFSSYALLERGHNGWTEIDIGHFGQLEWLFGDKKWPTLSPEEVLWPVVWLQLATGSENFKNTEDRFRDRNFS